MIKTIYNARLMRVPILLRLYVFLVAIGYSALSYSADNAQLLEEAHTVRSADPFRSLNILKQIDVDTLTPSQQDTFNFLQAYSLYIYGDIDASIDTFQELAEKGITAFERNRANAALVNLYAGTQNWTLGFIGLEALLSNISTMKSIDNIEQTHLAVLHFYNAIDEKEMAANYARPLLLDEHNVKEYSLRFYCTASMQWLNAQILADISILSEAVYKRTINKCESLNESIVTLGLHQRLADYYFKSEQVAKALAILQRNIDAAESSVYKPLVGAYYDLISQAFFELGRYEEAKRYAEYLHNGEYGKIDAEAIVTAYRVLTGIAELEQDYETALKFHKLLANAQQLNIDNNNARLLAIQKAERDGIEKATQIALLDQENTILKTQALLDKEAAENRLLLMFAMFSLLLLCAVWIYKKRSTYIKLREIAETDALTGIANRRFFTDQAAQDISVCEQSEQAISFIIFDLDFFKRINDNYGHQKGDLALKSVVEAVKHGCRKSDLIGRLGGEEFGILLECCTLSEAMIIAENCREKIEQASNNKVTSEFALTASFGVADSATVGYSFDALFANADKALYLSKANGRNCVTAFKLQK